MSAFPSSPRVVLDNKRPHESVDYIAHNAATKRRNAAPSDVDMVQSRLSDLRVVAQQTTSSISIPTHLAPEGHGRLQPPLGASPTQLAAANAARRRAKSAHAVQTYGNSNGNGNGNGVMELSLNAQVAAAQHHGIVRQQSVPETKQEKSNAPRPDDSSNSSDTSTDDIDRERDLPSGASFSVSIESRETRIDPKNSSKYTAFKLSITVSKGGISGGVNSWKVWHRYSEFVDFRSQLRRSNIQVTHLPPKTWQSNFLDTFLDARQYGLANWVAQLPSIFLLGQGAEDTIRIFLISSNMMKNGSDDSDVTSNPSTPSPHRGKTPQPSSNPGGGMLNVPQDLLNDSQTLSLSGKSTAGGLLSAALNPTPERPKRLAVVSMANFEMLKVLGKGSYGKVILVRKRDGKDASECYAMKVLKKRHVHQKRQVEHTKTERNVLASIKHPFIVKLHYAFQTGEKLHFVLTYASGGELFFHLQKHGRFPPKLALFYTAELTMAFGELHSRAVVFRDLKPENVLIGGDGHVLLADFGLSKGGVPEPERGTKSFCGTPEYLAPEVLARKGHGFAVDWWGLGALLYEMLTGLPPWYSRDRQKMFASIRNDPLVIPNYVAPEIQSLIIGLLDKDPKSRLGGCGEDAKEIKGHSIFRYVGWDQLYEKRVIPPWKPGDPSSAKSKESSSNSGTNPTGVAGTAPGLPTNARTMPFSPDTSNFEDTFTNMPVMSVGSEVSVSFVVVNLFLYRALTRGREFFCFFLFALL